MNQKQIKRVAALFLALMLVFLTACAGEEPKREGSLPPAQKGYTWIRDCVGRNVEVPKKPKRVAALDSFAGEAMVMIGAGERMVAAPNGVKSDHLLKLIYPGLDEVGVPLSGGTINGESLLSLQPDLILLKGAMHTTGGEGEKLEKLRIPYLVVDYTNMEEQQAALQMIGDALGDEAKERAAAINGYYAGVIRLATKLSNQIPEEKRCRVYHAINEITRTDGPDSLGYDWITCAGARCVSAGESKYLEGTDYVASAEQIFAWDPDVVICNEESTARYVRQTEKWAGLRAVRENQVYNIPVGATRWGQRGSLETFFAILWLGQTVYPQYYSGVDLKQEVFSFYKTYLGIELDDEIYAMMLAGDGIRGKSLGGGR